MADLAAAGRSHAAGLAGRVGREVVVQHEVLAVLAVERVDDLLVLAGAERGDDERLGFAAGEQRRAVGARQDADLGDDRPDRLGVAAVDARLAAQDRAAHDVLFQVLEELAGQACLRGVVGIAGATACCLGGVELVRCAPACPAPCRRRRASGRRSSRSFASISAFSGTGAAIAHGSLAQVSASSMIALMTGWKP